jgi:hypothetical protein
MTAPTSKAWLIRVVAMTRVVIPLSVLTLVTLVEWATAGPIPTYVYSKTISLPGSDILNIGSDGTNLLVLNNGYPTDTLRVYSPSGTLLNEFPTGSLFTTGIAWDGTSYIFAAGQEAAYLHFYKMATNGAITSAPGPFYGPFCGLGFDGTNILMTGGAGDSITTIQELSPTTYNVVGSITVDAGLGPGANSTVYGVATHSGGLFVSYDSIYKAFVFDSGGNVVQQISDSYVDRGLAFVGNNLYLGDRNNDQVYVYVPLPEPSALVMLLLGVCACACRQWRR